MELVKKREGRIESYSDRFPLLFRRRWPARHLEQEIAAVDVDALCAECLGLRKTAPRRTASAGKQYFVGHRGEVPDSNESNRIEERLAVALYNEGAPWVLPDGEMLRLIDYQVPLSATRRAKGIGKIDLLGVIDGGQFVVIELKHSSKEKGRGEAPMVALLEGLRYASILQANMDDFVEQAKQHFGVDVLNTPPLVMLLGPLAWWDSWLALRAAGAWAGPFLQLIADVKVRTGLEIRCLAHGDTALGGSVTKPRIIPVPTLLSVQLINTWR